jgi:hypothetical protein
MKPQIIRLSIFFLLGSLGSVLFAAQSEGSGWLAPWGDQLGITLEKTPSPTENFSDLTGTVKNVEKAKALLGEVSEGQKIALKYAGNVAWTVATESGSVRPCVVKVTPEGSTKTVTLVPDYKTHLLKVGPPPFRGSTRAHSGGR